MLVDRHFCEIPPKLQAADINFLQHFWLYGIYIYIYNSIHFNSNSITVCVQIITGHKFHDFHKSAWWVRESKTGKFPHTKAFHV